MPKPVRLRALPTARQRRPPTAADRLTIVSEKPLGRSHSFTQQRRLDTIEDLYRHHRIDTRQYAAAERCRIAFERCEGGMHCALDLTISGGSSASRMIPRQQVQAAALVREIKQILGRIDGRVVELVCKDGLRLEQVVERMGYRISRAMTSAISARLRDGLTVLADEWSPVKNRGVRGEREADAKPTIPEYLSDEFEHKTFIDRGRIKPGGVAHATSNRVNYVRS